jgi:hypothetical protein
VNNFSISWKLVFVAASVLVVTAVVLSSTAPALVQPLRVAASNLAATTPSSSIFARRAAMPDDVNQERRLSPGSIIGLICAIAASSVALGIAFGLRRKIDRIAGPDPDKADDD